MVAHACMHATGSTIKIDKRLEVEEVLLDRQSMERNRETRRINMSSGNGGGNNSNAGVTRRRHRTSRDSADEGAMDNSRLRERPAKRIDRSGRTKQRRRGDRLLHGSSHDDDSSDDVDDEDEDEEVSVRVPATSHSSSILVSSSSSYHQPNHHYYHANNSGSGNQPSPPPPPPHPMPPAAPQQQQIHRKSWKADEMLGVSVPRKARSAAMKRSHDSWVSGGGNAGFSGRGSVGAGAGDESISVLLSSASPSRLSSAAATTQVSPSSSNASGRKKMGVNGGKPRRQKTGEVASASLVQDELEVAQVLFGLTRQFESANESKSTALSPPAVEPHHPIANSNFNQHNVTAIAPKRKRPRKIEDESPTNSVGTAAKLETESHHLKLETASSPKPETNESSSIQNVVGHANQKVEDIKLPNELSERIADLKPTIKPEAIPTAIKDKSSSNLGKTSIAAGEETILKSCSAKEKSSEVKFTIDLMALPPEKLSSDENDLCSQDPDQKVMDVASAVKIEIDKKEKAKFDEALAEGKVDKSLEESDSKRHKGKEIIINKLQFDLERSDKDSSIDGNKIHAQKQPKTLDLESKQQDKSAHNASSSAQALWQGNFPPFGYTGQVPPVQVVLPPDGSVGSSSILQPSSFLSPQPRPKRCATHCYIAQKIHYHQRLTRVNPIWSAAAAAGTIPLYGAKQFGPHGVPASDPAVLGNAVHGNLLSRGGGSSKDNQGPSRATVAGQPTKEIASTGNGNAIMEGIEKKQFVVPQLSQSVSGPNMLPSPAFLFPVNQQQAAAAAAAVASMAATVSGVSKSTPPSSNSTPASGQTSSVNLSFAGISPNEAPQYLAIMQNGGYSFPIPANVAAASQQYRGLTPAGTIPFFSSPFYSSQVIHPSQLQQQQTMVSHPLPPHQAYQNASTSNGSSSSTKHSQLSQQVPGGASTAVGASSHGPVEKEKVSSSNPATAESRASQAQKNPYGPKYAISAALMPNANSSTMGGASPQADKQSWNQHQLQSQQKVAGRVDLPSSQVFAMPFASINGVATLPPGLDISSVTQNGMILQNLPEAFRQQFGNINIPTAYVAQQKSQNHNADEGASAPKEVRSANGKSEEDNRKSSSMTMKTHGTGSQHTLTFARPNETTMSSILNNNVVDNSSRTLNLIVNHSASATAPTIAGATPAMNLPPTQQLIQLQKPQQLKQLPMHTQYSSSRGKLPSSNNNQAMYAERMPSSIPPIKFSQPLMDFPQTVVQGGNGVSSSTQSLQWKANARAGTASPGNAASQSAGKNNVIQQQGRQVQQPMPSQGHQNHQSLISFGANMMNSMPTSTQSSSGAMINSPQNSGLKGSSITSQASSTAKPGSSTAVLPIPQQSSSMKISSNSNQKSSSVPNNRKPAAITGQPNSSAPNNSGSKLQHQLPQQSLKQPHPAQPQLFFPNGFIQPHPAQPNAAAVSSSRFYQARPPE